MKDTKRYLEANKIATEKTNHFVQNVNHGQSHGEVLKEYENEIQRLNRELLLTAMEAANTMLIKKEKCAHKETQMEFCGGSEYVERCKSCGATIEETHSA